MKNLNCFFEKTFLGESTGVWLKAQIPLFLLFIFSLVLFQLASCTKDSVEGVGESGQTTPLFFTGGATAATNLELSYDVAITRRVTFQNGLGASSPGWKRMQAVPETESYSLLVDIDNGNLYLLQDNITVQSYLYDQLLPEDKMSKMEVLNGTCTTYDSLGNVISSIPSGNLAAAIMDSLGGNYYNTPVDTSLLAADSINFSVNGNRVVITTAIADGDATNSTLMLDLNTGATLLELVYDDANPTRLVSTASHGYGANGILQSSSFTFYDHLSDGDVKRTDERWEYSNFSFNLF